MRTASILVLTLATLWSAAVPAHACSCMQVSAREALDDADAVFEGRVMEVTPEGNRVRVRFAVVQYWKDADAEQLEVTTANNSAACGIAFEPDTSWLVYASREGGELTAGLCSRTARIEDASADLEVLEAGVVPVDIGEDDEVEDPAPRQSPTQGGCASCAVGQPATPSLLGLLAALGIALVSRRRQLL